MFRSSRQKIKLPLREDEIVQNVSLKSAIVVFHSRCHQLIDIKRGSGLVKYPALLQPGVHPRRVGGVHPRRGEPNGALPSLCRLRWLRFGTCPAAIKCGAPRELLCSLR